MKRTEKKLKAFVNRNKSKVMDEKKRSSSLCSSLTLCVKCAKQLGNKLAQSQQTHSNGKIQTH